MIDDEQLTDAIKTVIMGRRDIKANNAALSRKNFEKSYFLLLRCVKLNCTYLSIISPLPTTSVSKKKTNDVTHVISRDNFSLTGSYHKIMTHNGMVLRK